MRLGIFVTVVVASLSTLAACTSSVTNEKAGDGGTAPPSSTSSASDGGPSTDGASTSDSATSSDASVPPASTVEANVDIDGACPAVAPCGGALAGTYDYTAGCVDDVFATARTSCPSLDASGAKVTVKGSLHFVGSALTRDVTTTLSGSIVIPATCSMGQCAAVEAALKGAFDAVSCTGATSCTCTVSRVDKNGSATTFSTSGTTVTTADGDTYSYCVDGKDLRYRGKSAGAEEGTWSLAKR